MPVAPRLRIEPLDGRHDRSGFEDDVESLDRYPCQQAGQDTRRRVAPCFVLVEKGVVPLEYCTLAATGVALSDLPEALAKRLPPSLSYVIAQRLLQRIEHA